VAYTHYERLTALDATFLELESETVHMHVGAVALFDAAPLQAADHGGFDFELVRRGVESALALTPRFRQRVARVPLLDHPVWVDDPHFHLDYHLRHTALPQPGSERMLKRLAGRILSQKLDRGKPLWEFWVVEGVEGGRFALIVKAHHCMVDGISGLDLLERMMRLNPDPTVEPAPTWHPRPAPPGAEMLVSEIAHRARFPLAVAREGARALGKPLEVASQLGEQLLAVEETVAAGFRPTAETPLNDPIGPFRRFDWTRIDLAAVREIRERLGGTLNDVVLATAAGAIGRFLEHRRVVLPPGRPFRAQVPVSTRGADDQSLSNRVVMLMAELPVRERDPVARLAAVRETMAKLKRSRQRAGVEILEDLGDRTAPALWTNFARFATNQRTFNVVITNVPGPPRPVYLLGAPMHAIHPLVPLAWNQALGIAVFSYDGGLHWGFHADWEALPDLHEHLVAAVEEEFEQLHKRAAEA